MDIQCKVNAQEWSKIQKCMIKTINKPNKLLCDVKPLGSIVSQNVVGHDIHNFPT